MIKLDRDAGVSAGGYYLYLPNDPSVNEAPLVFFTHGYGAYNPAIYGRWIEHLVRRGNIVVFPRYQIILATSPSVFTTNTVTAIKNSLDTLSKNLKYPKPILNKIIIIGHSYGGVVTANLAHNWNNYGIPKPAGILLACPGTNGFDSGRLPSYSSMDSAINILAIIEKDDVVVDSVFAKEIFESTVSVPTSHKNLIIHFADKHGSPNIDAAHGEPCSPDLKYDNGERNPTITLALLSRTDADDYYNYWKLTDALIDYIATGNGYSSAFGDTPQQRFMGLWSDGVPLKELGVRPKKYTSIASDSQNEMVINFQLYQNFPNPFNPSTVISYQLPVAGYVSLKVFDILGREVATLVNEFQNAGKHNSTFSTLPTGRQVFNSTFSSGVYLYRIEAGNFVQSKKMLLIK